MCSCMLSLDRVVSELSEGRCGVGCAWGRLVRMIADGKGLEGRVERNGSVNEDVVIFI